MIANDRELRVTLDRLTRLQAQLSHLRNAESNAANYRASASGFLAEIDRMQLEVREYLSTHPTEYEASSVPQPAEIKASLNEASSS